MNINNSSTKDIPNPPETNLRHNSDYREIYETAINKNYEIIQKFLEKINQLCAKNDDFQKTIITIEQKFTNLSEQFKQIRSDNIKVKYRSKNPTSKQEINQISHQSFSDDRGRPSQPSQLALPRTSLKFQTNFDITTNKNQNNKLGSTHFQKSEFDRRKSIECIQEEDNQQQKFGFKTKNVFLTIQKMPQQVGKPKPKQTMLNEQNIQNTDILHLNTKFEEFKQQLNDSLKRYTKYQQFQLMQLNFTQKLSDLNKIIQIMKTNHYTQIMQKINESTHNLQIRINQRVDSHTFSTYMQELSSTLCQQIQNKQKELANKVQTQKALQFLDNKINRLIMQNKHLKSYKFNSVQHNHQFDHHSESFSQNDKNSIVKLIRQQLDNINLKQSYFLKSKNFSLQINQKKQNQQKLKKIENTSNSFIRSNSTYIKLTEKEEQRPELFQWRQKVVKVLSKGDRKRKKVTYR